MVEKILNKKLSIKADNKRIRPPRSEVQRLLSDNTLAKKILKWSPNYSKKKGLKGIFNQLFKKKVLKGIFNQLFQKKKF